MMNSGSGTGTGSSSSSHPNNQQVPKKKDDPLLPYLLEAIREDNESQVVELLELDPYTDTAGINSNTVASGNASSVSVSVSSSNVRQRLVFSDSTMEHFILHHIIANSTASKSNSKNNLKKKKKHNYGYGIVHTRTLNDTTHNYTGTSATATTDEQFVFQEEKVSPFDQAKAVFAASEDDNFADDPNVILYFTRPDYHHLRRISQLILKAQSLHHSIIKQRIVLLCNHEPITTTSTNHSNHSTYTTTILDRIFQEEGIFLANNTQLSIHTLSMDWIPMETDVYSLEDDSILKQADIQDTPSHVINTMAQSLFKIHDIIGSTPTRIQSMGPLAEQVLKQYLILQSSQNIQQQSPQTPKTPKTPKTHESDLTAIIFVDRKVDLLTPMVTPLTYEGLLDDVFGIHTGYISITDPAILDPSHQNNTNPFAEAQHENKILLPLNEQDTLYAEVRDQHVEKFGSFLQEQAKALKESHSNFTDKKKQQHQDLNEIHQFVKQIPIFTQNLKSLTNHIHLAEYMKQHTTQKNEFRQRWQTERSMMESESCYDTLDDYINSHHPYRLLRLLCLQSLTTGGIKSSKYDSLRKDIVQTYG